MLRKFKREKYPYNPMRYRGIRAFEPDDNTPHSKLCDCKGCQQYLAVISRENPKRIAETDDGIPYVIPAQVMTQEDKDSRKSRLPWHDKNRPYQIENAQKAASIWRGGVYTQVRSKPAYHVETLPDSGSRIILEYPTVAQNCPTIARKDTGKGNVSPYRGMRPSQKRHYQKLERAKMRESKDLTHSAKQSSVATIATFYRRNGRLFPTQSQENQAFSLLNAGVQQPNNVRVENARAGNSVE